jgi:outer membrane protein OmpA-like peptidoglycan-associated protein
MSKFSLSGIPYLAAAAILSIALPGTTVAAQTTTGQATVPLIVNGQSGKVEGLIKARSGENIVLQTADNPNLIVTLFDTTDVGQVQGMFKARHKEMSMAALIPGLQISAEGTYNEKGHLAATKVRFKGNDLERAQSIQAGMHETNQQVQKNQEELAKQNAELQAQNAALQQHDAAIAANKAAIDAATARFGQLDDYYIMDEVTVYFDNGKTKVDPKYNSQLQALADKAKNVNGYMVEVTGYASTTGSAATNQKLSEERAGNVTNILRQQCKVPLTRMLAPSAMGESDQVGNDKTVEGQAENRRVVVRVLQNKAIAGV